METNLNASSIPKCQGESSASVAQGSDYLAPEKIEHLDLFEKVKMSEKEAFKWLSAMAAKGVVFVRLSPTKRAAVDKLSCLSIKLGHLNRQVQREGLSLVEQECNQLFDEIIRLLAVLNSPDPEGEQA